MARTLKLTLFLGCLLLKVIASIFLTTFSTSALVRDLPLMALFLSISSFFFTHGSLVRLIVTEVLFF